MIGILLALTLSSSDPAAPLKGWLHPPPDEMFRGAEPIAESHVYEVVASKLDTAVWRELAEHAIVALTLTDPKWFTGPYFRCDPGRSPFLMRAVYGHGGTGGYEVRRKGLSVLVRHGSLGRSSPVNKSALVVCLDFEPTGLYTAISIAE